MVDVRMFKDAFVIPKAPQQVSPAPAPALVVPEDPYITKLKFFFLKWLSIIIGGAAILLIIWRIILKF